MPTAFLIRACQKLSPPSTETPQNPNSTIYIHRMPSKITNIISTTNPRKNFTFIRSHDSTFFIEMNFAFTPKCGFYIKTLFH